jgi:uncharacterized protein DUF4124
MRIRNGLTTLFAVSALATAAHAELFRCTGPDGKTIYTDQKQTCPGAEASEPAGVVHRAPTPDTHDATSSPAAPSRDPHAAEAEADAAAEWKQKKLDAEKQLEEVRARRDWIKTYVSYCNRGAYVTTRDDAGLQQVVNCSELKREFHALEAKEAAASAYLDTGLAEECRKSGCLPGWLR